MMNVQETLNEGLKRAFTVRVPAGDIAARLDAQIGDIAKKIRMPGFRPGKAPAHLVRKLHGPSVTNQVLEETVQESSQQILSGGNFRPAMQPRIDVTAYQPEGDLEFTMEFEVLPEIPVAGLEGITLEKLVVPVTDADVESAIRRLLDQQKSYETAPADHVAAEGDAVVIDFVGKVDGEAFDGGTAEEIQLVLGSGQFIPGFEAQLTGAKAGDAPTVSVTFPEDYGVPYLKGKAALFEVVVREVRTAKPAELNDETARNFGLESYEQLAGLMRAQVEREHEGLARTYLKRKLLDHLHAAHDFAVPQAMVEAEFAQIWRQLEQEAGDNAEERAKIEAERDEYRAIAERRVRLGLLLSQLGQTNGVEVTAAETSRLIAQEAQKYRGQERQVAEYFQQNAGAAAQLRAPLFEEKVIDFILGKVELTERAVERAAIEAAIDSEDGALPMPGMGVDHAHHAHDHDCGDPHCGHDHAPAPAQKVVDATAAAPAEAVDAAPAKPKRSPRKPAAKKEAGNPDE